MTRYISIDCATKSIAVSVIEYNKEHIDLQKPETLSNLKVIKTMTKNLARNRANASISEVQRVKLINDFVEAELDQYIDKEVVILLEKQIATTPTYICYIALMSLFVQRDLKVITIAPAFKNQLVIADEKIGKYLQKYPTSYTANKEHSRAMSRLICLRLTDSCNISFDKKMETDFADSLCQLLALIILKPYVQNN
mgnify:CR=1 FL=1